MKICYWSWLRWPIKCLFIANDVVAVDKSLERVAMLSDRKPN